LNWPFYQNPAHLLSITTTKTGQPIENLIGLAIAQRIISAASEGRKFKVIVIVPAVPYVTLQLCWLNHCYNLCSDPDS
jgi:hypothetical protein